MTEELLGKAFEDDKRRAGAAVALTALAESVTEIVQIHRGNRKQTAVARFAQRDPVVVQVSDEATWLQTEATLLTEIRNRTSVPVPPVLTSGCHDDVAYMLTAYIDGADLHERFTVFDSAIQRELAQSFGTSLAHLHEAFQFDGYGTLETTSKTLTPRRDDWEAWFREYGHRAVRRLPPVFDPLRSELRELIADSPVESAPPARLYPWDFRPGNALVADKSIAAIVDWEAPLAAPASLSVAKAEYLIADWYVPEPEPLRDAFKTGYESVRPYPSVPTAYHVAAIADSAVDSTGTVTNPQYPELEHHDAVAFHRRALEAAVENDPPSSVKPNSQDTGRP
ncbi:phosphotransferase family protein [Natronorubrum bangense]|uniref:Phosphotransferase n=1 Tax=Natronorubrum bangense TaxID=61858 RepID=A0A4D6HTG9_9EURY|nr:fructosamine kinase family protein [Natronorubrum bangense]QCC56408.1 phosphotransferase [Natronorubrum bangense]